MSELRCSECGAAGQASCDCEMPYVPAGEYVAAKVLEWPEMSNRAVASKLGVHEKTVRRVRKATAAKAAVDKTIGQDGRKRTTKPKKTVNVIDLDPRRKTLEFRREAMKHLDDYEQRFKAWFHTVNLSEEAKESLISAFTMCADVFGDLAYLVKTGKEHDRGYADLQS